MEIRQSLSSHLQNALKSNPDLIYFAGYADDLAVLLVNLPTSLPNLQVLGGDGLYKPNAYPSSARPGFNRVRFTAFAYPDEWSILGYGRATSSLNILLILILQMQIIVQIRMALRVQIMVLFSPMMQRLLCCKVARTYWLHKTL